MTEKFYIPYPKTDSGKKQWSKRPVMLTTPGSITGRETQTRTIGTH